MKITNNDIIIASNLYGQGEAGTRGFFKMKSEPAPPFRGCSLFRFFRFSTTTELDLLEATLDTEPSEIHGTRTTPCGPHVSVQPILIKKSMEH